MKPGLRIALILLALALLLAACAPSGGAPTTAPAAAPTTAPAAAGAGEQEIVLKNLRFVPATVTIKAGATVRWVNQDSYPHTVTAGPRGAPSGLFDSGNLAGGQTFSFTFKDAGAYPYNCALHPGMDGQIIVQ